MVLAAPKKERRHIMLHAHDAGMTKGDYVFLTVDMLPDEEVVDPESAYPWKGNDGRDADAREAFEAVLHVSGIQPGLPHIHMVGGVTQWLELRSLTGELSL